MITEIKNGTSEEIIKTINFDSKNLIIIDFYKENCGPCKVMKATLKGVDIQNTDKIDIYCIDISEIEYEGILMHIEDKIKHDNYTIDFYSTPALFFIKNKEVIFSKQGIINSKEIIDRI